MEDNYAVFFYQVVICLYVCTSQNVILLWTLKAFVYFKRVVILDKHHHIKYNYFQYKLCPHKFCGKRTRTFYCPVYTNSTSQLVKSKRNALTITSAVYALNLKCVYLYVEWKISTPARDKVNFTVKELAQYKLNESSKESNPVFKIVVW